MAGNTFFADRHHRQRGSPRTEAAQRRAGATTRWNYCAAAAELYHLLVPRRFRPQAPTPYRLQTQPARRPRTVPGQPARHSLGPATRSPSARPIRRFVDRNMELARYAGQRRTRRVLVRKVSVTGEDTASHGLWRGQAPRPADAARHLVPRCLLICVGSFSAADRRVAEPAMLAADAFGRTVRSPRWAPPWTRDQAGSQRGYHLGADHGAADAAQARRRPGPAVAGGAPSGRPDVLDVDADVVVGFGGIMSRHWLSPSRSRLPPPPRRRRRIRRSTKPTPGRTANRVGVRSRTARESRIPLRRAEVVGVPVRAPIAALDRAGAAEPRRGHIPGFP